VSAGPPAAAAPDSGAESSNDGPVETDVDEMVAAVSHRAAEISKNVATLASTAGVEAAKGLNNLQETVRVHHGRTAALQGLPLPC